MDLVNSIVEWINADQDRAFMLGIVFLFAFVGAYAASR